MESLSAFVTVSFGASMIRTLSDSLNEIAKKIWFFRCPALKNSVSLSNGYGQGGRQCES